MDRESCRASIEQTESSEFCLMDRAIYREVLRKPRKTLIEEACVKRYRSAIELLSSKQKHGFSRREKTHVMKAYKIDTKPTIKKAC